MNYPLLNTYTKGLPYLLGLSVSGEDRKRHYYYFYPDNTKYVDHPKTPEIEDALNTFRENPDMDYFIFSRVLCNFFDFVYGTNRNEVEFFFQFVHDARGADKRQAPLEFSCCRLSIETRRKSPFAKREYKFSYAEKGKVSYDDRLGVNVYSYPDTCYKSGFWGMDTPQELTETLKERVGLKFLLIQHELVNFILSARSL